MFRTTNVRKSRKDFMDLATPSRKTQNPYLKSMREHAFTEEGGASATAAFRQFHRDVKGGTLINNVPFLGLSFEDFSSLGNVTDANTQLRIVQQLQLLLSVDEITARQLIFGHSQGPLAFVPQTLGAACQQSLVIKNWPSLRDYDLVLISVENDLDSKTLRRISHDNNRDGIPQPILILKNGELSLYGFSENNTWEITPLGKKDSLPEFQHLVFAPIGKTQVVDTSVISNDLRRKITSTKGHTLRPYEITTNRDFDNAWSTLPNNSFLICTNRANVKPILYLKNHQGKQQEINIDDVPGLQEAIQPNENNVGIISALNQYRFKQLGQIANYTKKEGNVYLICQHPSLPVIAKDDREIKDVVGPVSSEWKLHIYDGRYAFQLETVETTNTLIAGLLEDKLYTDEEIIQLLSKEKHAQDIAQAVKTEFVTAYQKAPRTEGKQTLDILFEVTVKLTKKYTDDLSLNDETRGIYQSALLTLYREYYNSVTEAAKPTSSTSMDVTLPKPIPTTTTTTIPTTTTTTTATTTTTVFTTEDLKKSQNLDIVAYGDQDWKIEFRDRYTDENMPVGTLDWYRSGQLEFENGRAFTEYKSDSTHIATLKEPSTDSSPEEETAYLKKCIELYTQEVDTFFAGHPELKEVYYQTYKQFISTFLPSFITATNAIDAASFLQPHPGTDSRQRFMIENDKLYCEVTYKNIKLASPPGWDTDVEETSDGTTENAKHSHEIPGELTIRLAFPQTVSALEKGESVQIQSIKTTSTELSQIVMQRNIDYEQFKLVPTSRKTLIPVASVLTSPDSSPTTSHIEIKNENVFDLIKSGLASIKHFFQTPSWQRDLAVALIAGVLAVSLVAITIASHGAASPVVAAALSKGIAVAHVLGFAGATQAVAYTGLGIAGTAILAAFPAIAVPLGWASRKGYFDCFNCFGSKADMIPDATPTTKPTSTSRRSSRSDFSGSRIHRGIGVGSDSARSHSDVLSTAASSSPRDVTVSDTTSSAALTPSSSATLTSQPSGSSLGTSSGGVTPRTADSISGSSEHSTSISDTPETTSSSDSASPKRKPVAVITPSKPLPQDPPERAQLEQNAKEKEKDKDPSDQVSRSNSQVMGAYFSRFQQELDQQRRVGSTRSPYTGSTGTGPRPGSNNK